MSEHVLEWLGAYHDGELRGRRLAQVQEHLKNCKTCRSELDQLRALTSLLMSPLPNDLLSPSERFVAQVNLRLPRRPAQPAWQQALERGWQMVPLGLLSAWTVAQAVFLLATGAMLAWRIGLGESVMGSWLSVWQGWRLFNSGGSLGWGGWGLLLYLGIHFIIGVLYWSWLTSWWAYRRHRQQ